MPYQETFNKLKPVLANYVQSLDITTNSDEIYWLDTRHIMKNGKPLFFGSVVINKTYVSFHLMPVYVFPELLKEVSPELKKRMQGKSCFNFKEVSKEVLSELTELTAEGYDIYKQAGYI